MDKPLPPETQASMSPAMHETLNDHTASPVRRPKKSSPTKPQLASATVPYASRVAPARPLHVPDLSRTGWTAWLSGLRAWYHWPRTATSQSQIAITSSRAPVIAPRGSSRRSSHDSTASDGSPQRSDSEASDDAPGRRPRSGGRRQYVPRRPKLFAKLRKTLAVTSLVVVGTLIGMFLVFAATTLFATTFVGCAVMLFLESTILVIPAILFVIFFVFVLIILGLSWLGLFGLRFGLDSWSLIINRLLGAAHWVFDSVMSLTLAPSNTQGKATTEDEMVPLDFGTAGVAPSA